MNAFFKFVMQMLSRSVRSKVKNLGIEHTFLFMQADGGQLSEIAKLIETGKIRPVVDRVFPFAQTNEALAYVDTGRAKGKVVIAVK